MNNLIKQYTSQLEKLTLNQLDDKTTATVTIPSAQLVMPTIAWDWPPAPNGTMLNNAFEFADSMPTSCQAETYYQPSAKSFTDNYRSFLSLLEVEPQALNKLIKKARRKIAVPKGNPADGSTPSGWTITKINGLNRWRPIWSFSDSASEWQQKVQSGSINNPGTITLMLKRNSDQNKILVTKQPGSSVTKPFNSNITFEKVEIKASSWGRIGISPGSWYDSAIISLTSDNLSPALRTKFFGTNGLLSCRIASFYVAYKVKITFYSKQKTHLAQQKLNQCHNQISAFGIAVNPTKNQVDGCLQFAGVTPDPVIVAVAIEDMNSMT